MTREICNTPNSEIVVERLTDTFVVSSWCLRESHLLLFRRWIARSHHSLGNGTD